MWRTVISSVGVALTCMVAVGTVCAQQPADMPVLTQPQPSRTPEARRQLQELILRLQQYPNSGPEPRSSGIVLTPRVPLTPSELVRIAEVVERNMVIDPSIQWLGTMHADIRVCIDRIGRIERAEVIRHSGSPDRVARAFAESKRDAVMRSVRLPLPSGREEAFLGCQLVLVFRGNDIGVEARAAHATSRTRFSIDVPVRPPLPMQLAPHRE
jgi:hypothetical protein